MNYEDRDTCLDLDYLHKLLLRYESIEEKTKEKIDVRNAVIEVVQPGIKAILLMYAVPLDWDMFQDAIIDVMKQIDKWNSSRTKRRELGDTGDWAYFVICTHNFCRNYVNQQNKRFKRETLVDPLEQSYWGTLVDEGLPEHLYLSKLKQLPSKRLQNAYTACIDSILGEHIEHGGVIELRGKLRDKFNLTHQETKDIVKLSRETIKEHIEGMQYD